MHRSNVDSVSRWMESAKAGPERAPQPQTRPESSSIQYDIA